MLSPDKLEANRVNAQHSTGPRTPEDKSRSSRNAVKHGLNSSAPFVRETGRVLTIQASKSAPVELSVLTDITKLLKQTHHDLPKSAQPIPFAGEPTLQDLENTLCSNALLHNLLAGAHP